MYRTLFQLLLCSALISCATSNTVRSVQLDSSLVLALCGTNNAVNTKVYLIPARGTHSIAGGSVICNSMHPAPISEFRNVKLEVVSSVAGLKNPDSLILVAVERQKNTHLSEELVDSIKIQAAQIGMGRVMMIDAEMLPSQGVYLGYAYR